MKMSDNLLDDLEEFVSGDWQEKFKEYQDDLYKDEMKEPVIPDFPSFREFYDLMVEMCTDVTLSPQLVYFINRFLRRRDNKLNKSFENVWEFFTDPSRYKVYQETCEQCRARYSVIVKLEPITPFRSLDSFGNMAANMTMRQEDVWCRCGRPFMSVAGSVIGVFKN